MVDVFAEERYAGNPLPVVICDGTISDNNMQRIAAEMDYSETTFITDISEQDSCCTVRIFTPSREIEFTGHPILGTAWVIRQYLLQQPADSIQLDLMVGRVTVRFEMDGQHTEIAWFEAPDMTLGAKADHQQVAECLGIDKDEILSYFPVQMISAGTSALIVPLKSLDAVQRCKLNLDAFADLATQGFPPLVYVFSQQTYDSHNDICARFFFDAHGVREDPATGNGAAFLGAYLLEYPILSGDSLSLRIEQGHQLRRPSLIMLRASIENNVRHVSVGGQVQPVLQGLLY